MARDFVETVKKKILESAHGSFSIDVQPGVFNYTTEGVCVAWGGVQLEGDRDSRGQEGGNNIESSDRLASVIIFSLQPATLFFLGSDWASLAMS